MTNLINEISQSFDPSTVQVLYEDGNIISVNKPEGLASISESDVSVENLHSILEKKLNMDLFIVHRLDKEVSGVILFAKNAKTHKLLNQQFFDRAIKKNYIALVHGVMQRENGSINKPIREFGSGRMGIDEQKGKPSKTNYIVIKKFKSFSLIQLNPTSGRRHQLRVHLYHIAHPIVGDVRYGDKSIQEKYPRLMLHAERIEFTDLAGKQIKIEAPIPNSFANLMDELVG